MVQEAFSIALIPDGWTQPDMKMDFLGLEAFLIYKSFEKRLLIIRIEDIRSGHSAGKK